MSVHDRAAAAIIAQLSVAGDGAFLGVGLAYVAYRNFRKFFSASSALRKIQQTPCVEPSDLRSLLSENDNARIYPQKSGNNSNCESEIIVIVRGTVDAQSSVKGQWTNFRGNANGVIVAHESGEKGVIVEQTQTYIYNESRGIFGWTYSLHSILLRSWQEKELSSIRKVPFILVETGKRSQSDYVNVNMEGSSHPLPLTTVYRHVQPINASSHTFFQALFGREFPVGLLNEEKILPFGKDITVVGACSLRDGIPEIKSSKDLPYFLSELNKDQMVSEISFRMKVLMWSGFIFGALAIGVFSYSIARNWIKLKEWRQQREARRQRNDSANNVSSQIAAADEESGDVPDGELCVICLTRRRRSAFIPCGHLVCCQRCALSVEREVSPKCPVCRQPIRNSVRIYDS